MFLRTACFGLRRAAAVAARRAEPAAAAAAPVGFPKTAGVPGVVGDDDQEVGMAGYQLRELAKGNTDPFFRELKCYHFGTEERPHLVPSFAEYRTVGCQGGSGHDGEARPHDLLWYNLHDGRDMECRECGQYFRLMRLKSPFPVPDGTDHHH